MSEERFNLELRGQLVTATPFANSPKGCVKKYDPDKGLQQLPMMPVFQNGAQMESPYIPASTFRGVLRRAAAEEVAEFFRQRGEDVRLTDWLLFSIGGVKGSEKESCSPRVRHEYIESNPLVALFGAGDAGAGGMIGSKLHIAHAIPAFKVEPRQVEGARAHEDKSPRLLEVLSDEQQDIAWQLTLANSHRSDLSTKVKDLERKRKAAQSKRGKTGGDELPEIDRQLDELKKRLDKAVAIQEQFGTSNAIGRPLPGYEVIPAGVEIPHRMTLADASLSQVGLFFAALRRFARDPVIGAHRSHGCGRLRGDYAVYRREGETHKRLGHLEFGESEKEDAEEYRNFSLHGDALAALDAQAANWRENADPANFRAREDKDDSEK